MLRADEPGEPVRRAEHERDGDDAAAARSEQRERREQQRQRRGELAAVERLRVAEQAKRQEHEVEQRRAVPVLLERRAREPIGFLVRPAEEERIDGIARQDRVLDVPRQRDRQRGQRSEREAPNGQPVAHEHERRTRSAAPQRRPGTSCRPPRRRRRPSARAPVSSRCARSARGSRAPARRRARAPARRTSSVPTHVVNGWQSTIVAASRPTVRPASRAAPSPVAATPAKSRSSGAKAPCTPSQTRKPSSTSISTVYGWYEFQAHGVSITRWRCSKSSGAAAWCRSASADEIGAHVTTRSIAT